MAAFAISSDAGFRIRAMVLWIAASLLVLGAHAACALVFLSWHRLAPTLGEPPAAIMIDLPANTPGLAILPRTARGMGDQQHEDEAVDAMPAGLHAMAATDGRRQDDSRASAIMAQAVPLPAASAPAVRAHHTKLRKPRKRARKSAKDHHHLAARRRLASLIEEPEKSAAAPVARLAAATAGAAVTAADIPSTWKSELLAQLERYKRYPEAARGGREEGTTLLSFTIDRDGHVLDSFVAHSSGFAPLDDETLAMLQRAAPLPKIPPEVPGETLRLVVPVHFIDE